jgi:hypothetical protein
MGDVTKVYPINDLPWRMEAEDHMGDPAWSIFDSGGARVAVGLIRLDAELVVQAVNALHEQRQ